MELPHARMVGWYDPGQLIATGAEVLVSTLFAHHADSRRFDAISGDNDMYIDYAGESATDSSGFWFDYLADTADGWDSTYTVASMVAAGELSLTDKDDPQRHTTLPRSQLLILGGDLVYPTPSIRAYDQRLVGPFATACPQRFKRQADVLALPGNHDWYDSLVSFRRLFCNHQVVAGWNTRQSRSYFTARLPHGWWLFGLDTQLIHDIDEVQMAYFTKIANEMPDDAKVILCSPEPFWVKDARNEMPTGLYTKTLLEVLANDILGTRLRIAIAGDIHHYRRHSSDDQMRHRITCGTGGAFLHPTHNLHSDTLAGGFKLVKSFPEASRSRRLTYGNLLFPIKNPLFGIVTGTAYLMQAWATGIHVGEQFGSGDYAGKVKVAEIGYLGLSEFPSALIAAIHSALLSPLGSLLYLVMIMGFVFFTDPRSKAFRFLGGIGHALAHVITGFFVYWLAAYTSITLLAFLPKSIPQYLTAGAILFAGGWLAGSIVIGAYLTISLNFFGMHCNEAFSSLRIQDWKGFLRLNIDNNGKLHVCFIGVERVPGRWKTNTDQAGGKWLPDDPKAGKPRIVDRFEV